MILSLYEQLTIEENNQKCKASSCKESQTELIEQKQDEA